MRRGERPVGKENIEGLGKSLFNPGGRETDEYVSGNFYCVFTRSGKEPELRINTGSNILLLGSDERLYERSETLVESYLNKGTDFIPELDDPFSFVICDLKGQKAFCARDAIGHRPFYYLLNRDYFVFSTELSAILGSGLSGRQLNRRWFIDSLLTVFSERDITAYRDIYRLPPAHYIEVGRDKHRLGRHWNPQNVPVTGCASEQDCIEQFREIASDSVKKAIRGRSGIGSELSGGLDSSWVTALAAEHSKGKINAFSHVLDEEALKRIFPCEDERHYSSLLAGSNEKISHLPVGNDGRGVMDSMRSFIRLSWFPAQSGFCIFSENLYGQAKRNGIEILFSGFGGDEAASSGAREFLYEMASGKKYFMLMSMIMKDPGKNAFKKLKAFVKYALWPLNPEYLDRWFNRKDRQFDELRFSAAPLNYAAGLMPLNEMKDYFLGKLQWMNVKGVREKQIARLEHPYIAHRLECSCLIGKKYGFEYHFPLLDKKLVEFILSLPPGMKYRHGMNRYMIRKAAEPVMPAEITWRKDKTGTTIPSLIPGIYHDHENIRRYLENAGSGRSGIHDMIDFDKLRQRLEFIMNFDREKDLHPFAGALINPLNILLFHEMHSEK